MMTATPAVNADRQIRIDGVNLIRARRRRLLLAAFLAVYFFVAGLVFFT